MPTPPAAVRLLACLSLIGLASCAAAPADSAATGFSVTDSAGVQLVRNAGDAAALDADTLPLVEELRIGVLDGEPAYQFHRITGVGTLADGRIAVAENGSGSIRLYDAGGRHLRDLGRVGGGPGEFNRALVLLRLAGDTAMVMDYTQTVVYDAAAGTHVGSWPSFRPDSATGMTVVTPAGRAGAGWLVQTQQSIRGRPRPAPGELREDTVELRRIALASGELGDLVLRHPGRRSYGLSGAFGDGEFSTAERLWDAWTMHVVGADGRIYLSPRNTYAIAVHDGDGRLVRRITRAHRPVPITDADVEVYAREIGTFVDTTMRGGDGTARDRNKRYLIDESIALGHPDALPPIRSFLVGRDGAIWVERADLHVEPAELPLRMRIGTRYTHAGAPGAERRAHWDRFDADGRFLGAVLLPPRFTPHEVTRETVLGVLRDESDVEYVARLRVGPR